MAASRKPSSKKSPSSKAKTPKPGQDTAAGRSKKKSSGAVPPTAGGVGSPPAPAASAARAQPGPTEVLGQVAWLMMQSPAHKHLFFADMEWLVMPALMLKQFRVFRKDNTPVALATWAYLDEESEARITDNVRRLRPGDWKSGDRLWLIDLIAPFGGNDQVLKELREQVFKDKKIKTLQPAPDGKGMAVVEW